MRKTLKQSRDRKSKRYQSLIKEFPFRMQNGLARQMHFKIYSSMEFFRGREISFINWVGL